MKKISALLCLIFLSGYSNAQWFLQNSGTNENLRDIRFTNAAEGWVRNSDFTKLYHSTNGGVTWFDASPSSTVVSYCFLNEDIGWYISRPWGLIFKTTDGGNNWTEICNLDCTEFWSLKFTSEMTGYATASVCLDGGQCFKSTDGGINWNAFQISSSLQYYHNLNVLDDLNLILFSDSSMFKTSNGGTSWVQIPENIPGSISQAQFLTPQIGWCRSNSYLYKTTDGGIEWQSLQVGGVSVFCFIDLQTGWYSSGGNIYRTNDGGLTWNQQISPSLSSINSFYFLNQNTGWAAGDSGTILFTPNGGLPVELVSFTAECISGNIYLSWVTGSEINNKGFIVERKNDAGDWLSLDFVNGEGTSAGQNYYYYEDKNPTQGKYLYRLKQIDLDGSFEYSKTIEAIVSSPDVFSIDQNYPNPFNNSTTIKYEVPYKTHIRIDLFNMLGERIAPLVDEEKEAGSYQYKLNLDDQPGGIYFYRMSFLTYSETKKMVLMK